MWQNGKRLADAVGSRYVPFNWRFCGGIVSDRAWTLIAAFQIVFGILLICTGQQSSSDQNFELIFIQVKNVMKNKSLNININPAEIYKAWISQRETETGEAS